jgi:Recombinase
VRRSPEDWVEADQRHEALVSEEDFERVQTEMKARSTGQGGNRRRYTQNPLLPTARHRPLRHRPQPAADAWQAPQEQHLLHLRLPALLRHGRQLGEVEQRIERQLGAIEAGVDPALVGERIRELKAERQEVEAAIAQLDQAARNGEGFDVEEAAAVLDSLPDLAKPLAEADPELRRSVFEAFRLRVEIDRNAGLVRLKALVSSAFSQAKDLSDVCAATAMRSSRLPYAAC